MLAKLQAGVSRLRALAQRLRVRAAALAVLVLAAAPDVLNALGLVDLRPLFVATLGEHYGAVLASLLPFLLAFMKPVVHLHTEEGA